MILESGHIELIVEQLLARLEEEHVVLCRCDLIRPRRGHGEAEGVSGLFGRLKVAQFGGEGFECMKARVQDLFNVRYISDHKKGPRRTYLDQP